MTRSPKEAAGQPTLVISVLQIRSDRSTAESDAIYASISTPELRLSTLSGASLLSILGWRTGQSAIRPEQVSADCPGELGTSPLQLYRVPAVSPDYP